MDRTQAPPVKTISSLEIHAPIQQELPSGCQLYHMKEVDDDAVKVDLIFAAGTEHARKLMCKMTGALLLSGTANQSSLEINESIDQLGGFTNIDVGTDEAVVSVLGLKENIVELVRLVSNALFNAEFDERELAQLIAEKRQRFLIEVEKVSTLARRSFIERIFPNSPHGNLTNIDDFNHLCREELVAFHDKYYKSSLQKITIVGNLDDQHLKEIKDIVSPFSCNTSARSKADYSYLPEKISVQKEGVLQSAIRVGRILFNKKHKDYIDFSILNTILGGYFGSRLMTSIREEKGYTYGIGSGVVQLCDTGYFFISTEVGASYREATLTAISEEIEKLQNELISNEELSKVRNYIIGQLLKNADGPFAQMDRFLSVEKYGLDLSYYNDVINHLNAISPERLRALAQTYLNWNEMLIVTAG